MPIIRQVLTTWQPKTEVGTCWVHMNTYKEYMYMCVHVCNKGIHVCVIRVLMLTMCVVFSRLRILLILFKNGCHYYKTGFLIIFLIILFYHVYR